MTTAAVLLALAGATVLWPRPPSHRRLHLIAGAPAAARRRLDPWWLVWAVPAAALLLFGAAPGAAAAMVAALIDGRRRRTRRDVEALRDAEALISALAVMGAELSVGAPVARACRAAADELAAAGTGGPVGPELARMAARAELGGDPGAASAAGPGPVRRLAQAWSTSLEFGLPMGEILAALRADLVARQDFAARTRAGLAGPRATAAVLAGLPLLGLVLGQAMGASPVRVLLQTGIGGALLVTGTALSVVGVLWAGRITDRAVGR